jgi:hypothetical protein
LIRLKKKTFRINLIFQLKLRLEKTNKVQEPFGELTRLLKPFALPFGLEYFLLILFLYKKKQTMSWKN